MRIWIDIDNAPHAQIMPPIIKELKNRGHNIIITARDYGQTVEILKTKGVKYKLIGKHPGKRNTLKGIFIIYRMIRLYFWAFDKNIDLAFSHGSRAMILPARVLGIPVITMYDYEYISNFLFKKFAKAILMPFVSKDENIGKCKGFPGLKEELYLWNHKYCDEWNKNFSLNKNKTIVILRPPATMAHYHNPVAEQIFYSILKKISREKGIYGIVVPRTKNQLKEISKLICDSKDIIILTNAVDGISMIKDSDIIIGGGGTMNREAALLGTPVYSIFQSKIGKVDKWLESKGRMEFISSIKDIEKIKFKKKSKKVPLVNCKNLDKIICNIIENTYNK